MSEPNQAKRFNFLHSRHRYRGQWTPQNLVFNANLQEFAQQVAYISALETNGKISPYEAYEQIKSLWKQLKTSQEQLGIETSLPDEPDSDDRT
jgi:hypothetical protein